MFGLGLKALAPSQPVERGAMPLLGCRDALAAAGAGIEVHGPLLESEVLPLFQPASVPPAFQIASSPEVSA